MPVNATIKKLFTKSRLLDSADIALSESELHAIFALICNDLNWSLGDIGIQPLTNALPSSRYFEIPLDWFRSQTESPTLVQLQEALAHAVERENDFAMYFENLTSLHKRRLKFQNILRYQPKPTMDQVGPRGLLEYGICDNDLLNSWLIWRKWIFDIDNRSGQETGYLFEPVLAGCIGGIAVGASGSPVRRVDAEGNPGEKGRQIDCYIGAENLAYEFKIRVTIAASGQGRWGEELSFPHECRAAGITPILLVLDPTPAARLTDLSQAFLKNGGRVYVGEAAWAHLEEKAGRIMSHFIDNYIKPPLEAINTFDTTTLSSIRLSWTEAGIRIEGENASYTVDRTP